MQFITALSIAIMASVASATIAFGTQGSSKVAWLSGDRPCGNTVVVSSTNEAPCDKKFTLRNGFTYEVRNCGDPIFSLYNGDGTFNHVATYHPKSFGCDNVPDIHEEWEF